MFFIKQTNKRSHLRFQWDSNPRGEKCYDVKRHAFDHFTTGPELNSVGKQNNKDNQRNNGKTSLFNSQLQKCLHLFACNDVLSVIKHGFNLYTVQAIVIVAFDI